jgi:hypothetical protein
MKFFKQMITASLVTLIMSPYVAMAADGNWKMGRIYYRMVCTACHQDQTGESIAPSTKTKAEWETYISADSHAAGKDKLSYYMSKAYKESIKDSNRAAAKFLKLPDDQQIADVKAFVMHGAKDGPAPARCN